jgi:xylulokinase
MARAVMEGAAYELRWALEPVRQAGLPVDRLWMVGGATQSSIWPGVVADATGVPLSLPQGQHWPAVGAALLAATGLGAFESIEAGLARFQRPARQIQPDPGRSQIYHECFATYRRLGALR